MPQLITPTTLPFVTVPAFKAHPTYLQLDNLRSGSASAAEQVKELFNILLMASNWAANQVGQPLHAHSRTDRARVFADRRGRIKITAQHTPVRNVTEIAFGLSANRMNVYSNPAVWIEDDAGIVYEPASATWSWGPGPLQLGSAPAGELYASATYVAAYANALLSAPANSGVVALSLGNVIGIQPGDVLQIWEPGAEEAVTVSAAYVPGTNPVALATATTAAHTAGAGVSQLPPDVLLAVILYGVAMLTHPDRQSEDEWPDADTGPSTRGSDARQSGAGLVAEARRLLAIYKDQR